MSDGIMRGVYALIYRTQAGRLAVREIEAEDDRQAVWRAHDVAGRCKSPDARLVIVTQDDVLAVPNRDVYPERPATWRYDEKRGY